MAERRVVIRNRTGLHMRPAEVMAHAASKFRSDIYLTKDDVTVNGKSIMGVMMLAAEYGSEIIIQAVGEDEHTALETLSGIVEDGFGEGT